MEYLGYNRRDGAVYEGEINNGYRVLPPPALAPIRFFTASALAPLASLHDGLAPEIFREDDFDPVTKLRRGRVFRMGNCVQPHPWHVHDPHQDTLRVVNWAYGTAQEAQLSTYERHILSDLANMPAGALPTVAIGWEPHVTFWKIISIECNLAGTPVLSLRARHSLGDTPELIASAVPPELIKPLTEAIEKVESSVNRLSPIEVIDRCRDALSVAFGHQGGDRSRDLSVAIGSYLKVVAKESQTQENLCSWCGRIVARLHSRGKPNEQAAKGLRAPTDSDADLALNCLKTVLIEFGWAR